MRRGAGETDNDVKSKLHPSKIWEFYNSVELATVARVLLNLPASEAAVERSFSTQGFVHRKLRNRLNDSSIENEMFISFNLNSLNNVPLPPRSVPKVLELSIDFLEPIEIDEDEESEVETEIRFGSETEEDEIRSERKSDSDSESKSDSEEENSPAEAVAAVELMRTQSDINTANKSFLEKYIDEEKITLNTKWTGDRTQLLEAAATYRNKGGYTTKQLIYQIKFILNERMREKDQEAAAAAAATDL